MSHTPHCDPAALDRAARLILTADKTIAMTGAGLSVESGIRPFRGPGGLWTEHGEPPMDGYERFLADPAAAWERILNQTGPMAELVETLRTARPNAGHRALADLEESGFLSGIITQNIDALHRVAGSRRVAEIHGNFTLVRCVSCGRRSPLDELELADLPPHCAECGGILKSDTVAFGEAIPVDVLNACVALTDGCDCMLVIGTSATVYPAAQFPLTVRGRGGHLIEVNPYRTEISDRCAVSLQAPAGQVLPSLVARVRTTHQDDTI